MKTKIFKRMLIVAIAMIAMSFTVMGERTCDSCGGSGKMTCPTCNGSPRFACPKCGDPSWGDAGARATMSA